jgi:DNA-binding sugar fermentation-stimulating protein
MPGKFLTTLFNGPSTAAGSAFQPQADNKILWTYKSANSASISVQWQGSVDGVAWVNVGSAQTGTTGASDSTAWPLMRANVTVTTNTAKTLTSIARVGSTATATLVAHGLFPEFDGASIRAEVAHGRSRFDFRIGGVMVEVKSVTLAGGGAGRFPTPSAPARPATAMNWPPSPAQGRPRPSCS